MLIAVSGAAVGPYEPGGGAMIDAGPTRLRCRGQVNWVNVGAEIMTGNADCGLDTQDKFSGHAL
ncbi:hypothetical protein SPHV1_2270153 [Novosphingobium sp. KN65.2]|nr:hypothetical protein SPHV1_2270153 [Novosphingobium sp. KN65.2]